MYHQIPLRLKVLVCYNNSAGLQVTADAEDPIIRRQMPRRDNGPVCISRKPQETADGI